MFRCPARIILSSLFVLGSQTVNAQDNVGEDSTVVYPANYFNEWTPVTAQDMLDRIPGLSGGGSSYSGVAGASEVIVAEAAVVSVAALEELKSSLMESVLQGKTIAREDSSPVSPQIKSTILKSFVALQVNWMCGEAGR